MLPPLFFTLTLSLFFNIWFFFFTTAGFFHSFRSSILTLNTDRFLKCTHTHVQIINMNMPTCTPIQYSYLRAVAGWDRGSWLRADRVAQSQSSTGACVARQSCQSSLARRELWAEQSRRKKGSTVKRVMERAVTHLPRLLQTMDSVWSRWQRREEAEMERIIFKVLKRWEGERELNAAKRKY